MSCSFGDIGAGVWQGGLDSPLEEVGHRENKRASLKLLDCGALSAQEFVDTCLPRAPCKEGWSITEWWRLWDRNRPSGRSITSGP